MSYRVPLCLALSVCLACAAPAREPAPSFEDLNEKVRVAYEEKGQVAVEAALLELLEFSRSLPEGDPRRSAVLERLALLYALTNRYVDSLPLIEAWVREIEAAQGPRDPRLVKPLTELALNHAALGDRAGGVSILERAVRIAEQDPDAPGAAKAFRSLAQAYGTQLRPEDAIRVHELALATLSPVLGSHTDLIVHLAALGEAAHESGDQGRAALYLEEALVIARSPEVVSGGSGTLNPHWIVRALSFLGAIKEELGQLEEADALSREALDMANAELPADDLAMAIALNNMASGRTRAARYREAEPMLRRALVIVTQLPGPEPSTATTIRNNLGELLVKTKRPIPAEPLLREALAGREALLGPDHPWVGRTSYFLSLSIRRQGRVREGIPFLERTLELRERDDHLVAVTRAELGDAYLHIKEKPHAIEAYERALDAWDREPPMDPDSMDRTRLQLARLLDEAGKSEAAAVEYRRLLGDEGEKGPTDPAMAGKGHMFLAEIYIKQRKFEKATRHLERGIPLLEDGLRSDHRLVGRALTDLGGVYLVARNNKAAERALARATRIREQELGSDHAAVAETLEKLARAHARLGRFTEAKRDVVRVIAIREKTLGKTHPATQRAQSLLAKLQARSQRGR